MSDEEVLMITVSINNRPFVFFKSDGYSMEFQDKFIRIFLTKPLKDMTAREIYFPLDRIDYVELAWFKKKEEKKDG